MSLNIAVFAGLYGCFLLFAVIFVVRRLIWRVRRKGFRPSGVEFGNALQRLQIMAQPEVRYVIEKKDKIQVQNDEEGGPPLD